MGDVIAVALPEDAGSSAAEFAKAVGTLAKLSKGSNYLVIKQDTSSELQRCLAKMPPKQATLLLCDGISALLDTQQPAEATAEPSAGNTSGREEAMSAMAVHLLLDTLPEIRRSLPRSRDDADVQRRTASLFAACMAPARLRMAAKVAANFELSPAALHAAGVLQDLPRDGSGTSAALGLLAGTPRAELSGAHPPNHQRALAEKLPDRKSALRGPQSAR